MVILYFSCNFNVVVVDSEYRGLSTLPSWLPSKFVLKDCEKATLKDITGAETGR